MTTDEAGGHRFYGELARWWPLLSPVAEYTEEAGFLADLLGSATADGGALLELGSGGGHNAAYLKRRFAMTLVDLSPEMLEVSRALNPECDHALGDMRTYRAGRVFDAVLIHDAIDYMTTESDVRLAVRTAFEHCRPGGVAVLLPDDVTDRFAPSTDCGGVDADGIDDGGTGSAERRPRGARYLSWTWDPDPGDHWVLTEYAFLLREEDGSVRSVHETHRTGLFGTATWLAALTDAGFAATAVDERTTEDRPARVAFVGRRPPLTVTSGGSASG